MLWNIKKANEELEAVDSILSPALQKAKVTHALRGGQSVAIADASRSERLAALFAANPIGEGQQQQADLLVTNAHLAERLEKTESDLIVAQSTVSGLQAEKRTLTSRVETTEASVQTLTNEKAQKQVELDAALKESARITAEKNAFNTELSKMCLLAGCLTLPADANEADKLAAAEAIPVNDKLNAYKGAVHGALSRIGVTHIPGSAPTSTSKPTIVELNLVAQLEAIKDPTERAKFIKAHTEALWAIQNKK